MAIVPNAGGRGYWHQMGNQVTNPDMTAVDAARAYGLDYTITKRPLQVRNAKGHFVNVPSHFAVMSDHDGDPDVIAIVGKEFEPVQNIQLATMLDAAHLTGPDGLYSLDVVGKTVDGRTVFWALASRKPIKIAGDTYKDHWLIADGKDGNRALTMALTPIRHICSNAIAMAVSGASVRVAIQHTKRAESQLGWWLAVAPKLDEAAQKAHGLMAAMGRKDISLKGAQAILEVAYPSPKVRGKAQLYEGLDGLGLDDEASTEVTRAMGSHATDIQRVQAKRQAALDLFESYASDPAERNIAGTLLGIVNAVADCENHRPATNVKEDVGVSNLYGQRYAAQAASVKAALAAL